MTAFQNKYAPKCFDDLVFANPHSRERLKAFAESKSNSSIILYGPVGTAKSTTARILAESRVGRTYGKFHASDLKMKSFDGMLGQQNMQKWMQGVELPVTIADEIDYVDEQLQFRLRKELEADSAQGCFVFTTNKLHAVDGGLKNRCGVVEMPAIDPEDWLDRSRKILELEGIKMPDEKLRALLDTCDGSIRDLMRALEEATLRLAKAA